MLYRCARRGCVWKEVMLHSCVTCEQGGAEGGGSTRCVLPRGVEKKECVAAAQLARWV